MINLLRKLNPTKDQANELANPTVVEFFNDTLVVGVATINSEQEIDPLFRITIPENGYYDVECVTITAITGASVTLETRIFIVGPDTTIATDSITGSFVNYVTQRLRNRRVFLTAGTVLGLKKSGTSWASGGATLTGFAQVHYVGNLNGAHFIRATKHADQT
jgi:hypothetical protein